MGNRYQFRCMHCSYETQCSKGPDRGMMASVAPFICKRCAIVGNCTTGEAETRGGAITIKVEPKCRECNSGDNLIPWDLLTCPKCGEKQMHYHYLSMPWD